MFYFQGILVFGWGLAVVCYHEQPPPFTVEPTLRRSILSLSVCGRILYWPSTAFQRGDSSGPFFTDLSHKASSKQRFVKQIRNILSSLGLQQDQYTGHSFRIGTATTAAAVGVQDSTIQMLGRWHSSAFLQYICTPKEQLASLSGYISGGGGRGCFAPPWIQFAPLRIISTFNYVVCT